MDSSSNQTTFCTLTADYPAIKVSSGTSANTASLVTSGSTHGSVVLDLLFRSLDNSARNWDIYIGSTSSVQNGIIQIQVPANAGNNGSVALCSLAALAPAIFDIDLAGNRVLTLESGTNLYVMNKTSTTGDVYVMAKRRNF